MVFFIIPSATFTIGSDPASTAALIVVASVVPSDVQLVSYKEEMSNRVSNSIN